MRRVLVAGLVGLMAITLPAFALAQEDREAYDQLDLFGKILEEIRSEYVEEVSTSELIDAAIEGMIGSLDPHSKYHNPKSYKEVQVQARGEFGGLGIEVTMEDGLVKVITPIDDTPAQRAGIQPGDLVTHLDGEQVLGLTLQQAVDKMRGPVNSEITLTVRRGGVEESLNFPITRAIIKIRSVRARVVDDEIIVARISRILRAHSRRSRRGSGRSVGGAGRSGGRRRARPAQQSRRPARSGNRGLGRVPGAGRNRIDPRARSHQRASLQRARRRHYRRPAAGRPDQRWDGIGLGNRGGARCRITGGRSFSAHARSARARFRR